MYGEVPRDYLYRAQRECDGSLGYLRDCGRCLDKLIEGGGYDAATGEQVRLLRDQVLALHDMTRSVGVTIGDLDATLRDAQRPADDAGVPGA